MQNFIKGQLEEAALTLDNFLNNPDKIASIQQAADMMIDAIRNNKKIMSCGNGGSHCDAMHFAEELTGRYRENRPALPAVAISDVSHITCVGNDFGFDQIFSRYIEGMGNEGDILLGISTSGNSKNVINAIQAAKERKIKTIALTGKDGGALGSIADIEIRVDHTGYADRIQEIHIKVIHIFILLIEKGIYG